MLFAWQDINSPPSSQFFSIAIYLLFLTVPSLTVFLSPSLMWRQMAVSYCGSRAHDTYVSFILVSHPITPSVYEQLTVSNKVSDSGTKQRFHQSMRAYLTLSTMLATEVPLQKVIKMGRFKLKKNLKNVPFIQRSVLFVVRGGKFWRWSSSSGCVSYYLWIGCCEDTLNTDRGQGTKSAMDKI